MMFCILNKKFTILCTSFFAMYIQFLRSFVQHKTDTFFCICSARVLCQGDSNKCHYSTQVRAVLTMSAELETAQEVTEENLQYNDETETDPRRFLIDVEEDLPIEEELPSMEHLNVEEVDPAADEQVESAHVQSSALASETIFERLHKKGTSAVDARFKVEQAAYHQSQQDRIRAKSPLQREKKNYTQGGIFDRLHTAETFANKSRSNSVKSNKSNTDNAKSRSNSVKSTKSNSGNHGDANSDPSGQSIYERLHKKGTAAVDTRFKVEQDMYHQSQQDRIRAKSPIQRVKTTYTQGGVFDRLHTAETIANKSRSNSVKSNKSINDSSRSHTPEHQSHAKGNSSRKPIKL